MTSQRDRDNPAYDKPAEFDQMVAAAYAAAKAARASGADYDTEKRSAEHAALQIAGLKPLDPWNDRQDLA